MLHPQNNSLEYSVGIAPPEGYELKYAIGTSYSLDLEALLLIPIAMIYASHIEKVNGDLTYGTISALTEVSKKIDLYCHKGNIKNPKLNNSLFSFWEESIHEISLDSANKSFHPKVWVMQFINREKEIRYKLFVSSKNLAQSGNWDIAYSTEGEITNELQPETKPIVDFVKYLIGNTQNKIPNDFISNLEKVQFELPDNWKSQKFHPIGIPNYENILAKKKFDELLIISPFLDKKSVDRLINNSEKLTLCSTKNALDEIKAKELNTINYQFNTLIETVNNNEEMFDEIDEHLLSQALHAKLFIGKRGETISWNFGSANATSPALEARNIEFNVELIGKQDECCPKQILKQLIPNNRKDDKDIKLFEPYLPSKELLNTEEKKLKTKLRNLIFELNKLIVIGKLNKSENQIEFNLRIEICTKNISFESFAIKVKPLSCYQAKSSVIKEGIENELLEYHNISLNNINQFIIWEIYYNGEIQKEFLTKMAIDIPIEERRGKILKSLFDTKEKLFKYISFLITNDENEVINLNDPLKQKKESISTLDTNNLNGLPIYEKLLIASSRMPHKLEAISKLIRNLTEENEDDSTLITKDFKAFWAEFENYLNTTNGTNS